MEGLEAVLEVTGDPAADVTYEISDLVRLPTDEQLREMAGNAIDANADWPGNARYTRPFLDAVTLLWEARRENKRLVAGVEAAVERLDEDVTTENLRDEVADDLRRLIEKEESE